MEKPSKLTTKKLIVILAAAFVVCGLALGVFAFFRNSIKEVAAETDYGYINPDESKAETDAGFVIDGVLDEAQYQKNNWLYLSNKEGGADVDIAMTSYYGEKGMYFVYDVTEGNPIYVNTTRASYLNSCVEMYLAPNTVMNRSQNSMFEIDLLPTGDMTFKKSNGKGGYVNVATTDDMMAVLGTTTKGGEINTEDCYGYCLELFIPWEYMDKFDLDAGEMKDSYVYVNPAHITSFNYEGTDTNVDRYWYHFAQQHGAGLSNVYQYYRFDGNGVQGTVPVELQAGEHYTIKGRTAVIPGMKTNVTITPEKGYALNSILINGEEYITKANFNEDGAVTITERGVKGGVKISATAVPITDGNKTLSGTVIANKYGGGSLKDVSASYTGPTGEKPLEFEGNGKFTLPDLKPGYYKFTIEKEGYEKLVRGIYVNRDMEVELSLEYQAFTVTGASWIMDDQNDGIIYKFGGSGNLLSNEKYNKFAVEATFRYDKEAAKAGDADVFSQQRKGLKVAFSNEKVWHIDLLFQDGKYIVQYAKHSGKNSLTGWKEIHALTAAEAAKFTGEDGIKLSVERDGKYANVYLDGKRIAVEVFDDEFAKCTAQIGFEAWAANREVEEIPYKITTKTSVNMKNTLFKMTNGWDVLNQYDGLISMPEGGRGNLQFINKYVNMDFTLRVKDDRTMKEYDKDGKELFPRTDVLFVFENGAHISFGTSTDEDGMRIQSLNNAANKVDGKSTQYIYKRWTDWGTLTDEEFEQYINGGVDLRIVRYGTEITLYIGDRMIGIADLTNNDSGVTADMPATVTIRHYDDAGVKIDMPFSLKEPSELVNVTAATSKNGKIVTEKKQYFVGDIVKVSGKGNEGYYCNAIKVNGQNVTLNWDGTYTFTATEKNYTVEGNYVKRVFKDSKEWNLLKQNEGVISLPKDHDGDSGWVEFYNQYEDVDLTLTTRDYIGNNTELRTAVRFAFENGETLMLSIAYTGDTYQVQSMKDTLYGWSTHHKLSDDQLAAFQSEEGINLRLVRMGTEVLAYLDDALIKVCDLTTTKAGKATEITADMPMTVSIRHYGNDGFAAEIPFEVKEEVPEVVTGNIDLPNGGRLDTVIRHYVEDLDLTLRVQDHPDSTDGEGVYPRTDVLFVFENGAHISFGISSDGTGAQIKALNRNKNDNEQIYGQWTTWGTLIGEEFEQYKDGGVDLRLVRCGTEISLYVGDRFVTVADLTNNDSGVTADTKAKVTVRHYDDAGAKMNIPFEWTEVLDLITVKKAECEHGKVVTQKENYIAGDTVIISGKADDGYYCTGLKVNGEDVAMEMMNGTYTFKATEEEYTVAATFAKSIFATDKLSYWNILRQQEGIIVHRDDFTDRETAQPLYFADTYKNSDASIIVKANADDFNEDGTLKDANGDRSGLGYETSDAIVGFSILLDTKGAYHVAHAGTSGQPEGKWASFYKLSEAETKKITEGDGIELRVIRVGTEAKVYLDGKLIRTQVLPYKADEATSVWMRRWDDRGVLAEIPFTISEDIPNTVAINVADATNGTVTTEYKSYFANEQVTLVVEPGRGHDCTSLKVNGSEVAFSNNRYTFTATEMSYTVEAVFEKNEFYYETYVSILGDSISTYEGISNVGTTNSTIEGYNAWYNGDWKNVLSSEAETYWGQIISKYQMKLLVNNSCGGNRLLDVSGTGVKVPAGHMRVEELAADTGKLSSIKPDIILINMGTNDYIANKPLGDHNDATYAGVVSGTGYKTPDTFTEAYIITLEKAKTLYPDAKIYCFTLLPSHYNENWDTLNAYNTRIREIVAKYDTVTLVDVAKDSDITTSNYASYTFDGTHPNKAGIAEIAKILERALLNTLTSTVVIEDNIENGSVTTDKEKYAIGEEVTLTVAGATGYFYDSLTVDGVEVGKQVDANGQYKFTTTKMYHKVEASFAEPIFDSNTNWNVLGQNAGILRAPATSNGNSGWVSTIDSYNEATVTVKDLSGGTKTFGILMRLNFSNGKNITIRLVNDLNGTNGWVLQSEKAKNGIYIWDIFHNLDASEISKVTGDGIEFKLVRVGTTIDLYLDGEKVVSGIDLTVNNSGVTAEMTSTVQFKLYGNNNLVTEIPFSVSKDLTSTIMIEDNIENGNVTTDKEQYAIGEKVTLTVAGSDGYYHNSLTVDGVEVGKQVDANGQYTFTTTKAYHKVDASFAPAIFDSNTSWNVLNQNVGILRAPATSNGNSGWVSTIDSYNEATVTVKDLSGGTKTFGILMRLNFSNGKNITIRLVNDLSGTNGWVLQSEKAKNGIYIWDIFHNLDATEISKVTGDGIEFKLVRVGTTIDLYLDGKKVVSGIDLTVNNSGVTAEMTSTVQFKLYGNNNLVTEIPFSVSKDLTSTIMIEDNIENGNVTTDKEKCAIGEKVTLTVAGSDGYYHNSLTVDGVEVGKQVDANGQYTFTTTKAYHKVEASFSEGIFTSDQGYNITSQNVGILRLDANALVNQANYIRTKENYDVISATVKYPEGATGNFLFREQFYFTNGKTVRFVVSNDGGWHIESAGGTYGWNVLKRALTDDEITLLKSEDGLEFKMVRQGVLLYVYLNGKLVNGAPVDISTKQSKGNESTGITADLEAYAELSIQREGSYAVETNFSFAKRSEISIAETTNGSVSIKEDKTYYTGDEVTLTLAGDLGYYYNSLKIDGVEVGKQVDANGEYTFTATKANHTVEATFSEGIFTSDKGYNVTRQNVGILRLDANALVNQANYIRTKDYYDVISATVKYPKGATGNFLFREQFYFTNGKTVRFVVSNDGGWHIESAGGTYGWNVLKRALTDDEIALLNSKDGLEFKMVRQGVLLYVYLNGELVAGAPVDISTQKSEGKVSTGITADLEAYAELSIQRDGTYAVETEFSFSNQ